MSTGNGTRLDEVPENIMLFDVLDYVGFNEEYRRTSQRLSFTYEILQTYLQEDPRYLFGSRSEGTLAPDAPNDLDGMICDKRLPVIEDLSEADQHPLSLLIVRESNTPVGYLKLQPIIDGVPCTYLNWPKLYDVNIPRDCLTLDSLGRMVLFDTPSRFKCGSRDKNKPATKLGPIDIVICFRCQTWPLIAREWLFRRRLYGWPSKDTIQEISLLGFFVVKKGHPFSSEKDLEWRISFSLQERNLMFNLSDVQYKCYLALKMLNRDFIKLDCITSYHWKTCVLFVIEENEKNVWQKYLFCHSVKLCIKQMLKWVNSGFCPNYFIPRDNLFDGKMNDREGLVLENTLKQLLDAGFRLDLELYKLLDNNPKIRRTDDWFQWLLTKRKQYERSLIQIKQMCLVFAGSICNSHLLDYDYNISNKNIASFIKCLWERIYRIQRDKTVTEHTLDETKKSLSLLIPFIYVSLASNISSIAIHHPNQQVRCFLLLGSLSFLIKGDLSGRLKCITVLYAIGLYKDCQWFLEREDEHYIRTIPSVCVCSASHLNLADIYDTYNYTCTSERCTCVSFLPSELPITPDAMKYEMFRYIGIVSPETKGSNVVFNWKYRAVVDCNIYFFFLKYLINKKLRRYKESDDARRSIIDLLIFGPNVKHRDVACNLLTWMFWSDCLIPNALRCLKCSWQTMSSFSPVVSPAKEEMLQYQYNAAKLHALVLLYNTWFVRQPSSFHFCFQCFNESQVELQKCSNCKISTYCSKTCQRKNWRNHKEVCKIVRSYQPTYPLLSKTTIKTMSVRR